MATNEKHRQPVTISRTGIGFVTLHQHERLQEFALQNAMQLASLLHILKEVNQTVDGSFITDMLELANDMAFQVQQSVDMLGQQSVPAANTIGRA